MACSAMIPPVRTIPVSDRARSGLDRGQSGLNWSELDYDTIVAVLVQSVVGFSPRSSTP